MRVNIKMNYNEVDPFFTSIYVLYFGIRMSKPFKTEDEAVCGYVYILFLSFIIFNKIETCSVKNIITIN
jgi:hypothetical protein